MARNHYPGAIRADMLGAKREETTTVTYLRRRWAASDAIARILRDTEQDCFYCEGYGCESCRGREVQ